jgi:hypothetical protein
MIFATIKSIVLDKNSTNNLSLQVLADIYNDTGRPVKFKLTDENGSILESSSTYVATPIQISKFFFLSRDHFDTTSTNISLYVEDETGAKQTVTKAVDTFQLNNVERTKVEEFQWSIRNFSTVPIFSRMEVVNESGKVLFSSNEYAKLYGVGYTQYRYLCNNLDTLPDGYYYYRVKYYTKNGWTKYYPDSSGIKMQVRNNTNPKLKIKDTKVRKETDHFSLSSRIIFSDNEEDDITYSITDNLGNLLLQMTNYTYSPQLEHLRYEYPLVHFNQSYLTVKVEVTDKLFGQSTVEETIKLWNIYDFYRERKRFKWKFRNYSNKSISMQVHVTDFDGNIIKTGTVMRMRDSFEYVDIEDPQQIEVDRDYYKYRIKVWCEEEGWVEYYDSYYESGVQFTERPHKPPVVDITEALIYRDLDDKRYLILKADITDAEQDQFLFTVTDDSGHVIRRARDFMDTPGKLDFKTPYDLIDRTHVNITVTAEDDNSGIGSDTVLAPAFKITGLSQEKGHIFRWYLDNYSRQVLKMQIEILKENEDGKKEVIRQGNIMESSGTIRPKLFTERLYPKLPEGDYYYRLKVISDYEEWSTYYPDEEGYKFHAGINHPPIIELNSIELTGDGETKFNVFINGTIRDEDADLVKYTIRDHLGKTLYDSKVFVETPATIEVNKSYDITKMSTARLVVYIDALDEGDAMNTVTEILNLFEIQNLYRDYDKFYWLFKNYSNLPVTMKVEILDHEGYLAGAGSEHEVATQLQYRQFREIINFKDYDEGHYFFRIRVFSKNESWSFYYPNKNGLPFEIKYNDAPEINITGTNVSKVANRDEYYVGVKAVITDKQGDKVYLTIKDEY